MRTMSWVRPLVTERDDTLRCPSPRPLAVVGEERMVLQPHALEEPPVKQLITVSALRVVLSKLCDLSSPSLPPGPDTMDERHFGGAEDHCQGHRGGRVRWAGAGGTAR